MVAGVVHRAGLDRAVLKVQVRAELQTLQLLLTKRQILGRHGKGNDGQDFFHGGHGLMTRSNSATVVLKTGMMRL
jgi:hypothetical protein